MQMPNHSHINFMHNKTCGCANSVIAAVLNVQSDLIGIEMSIGSAVHIIVS